MRKDSHALIFDSMLITDENNCMVWTGYSIKSNFSESHRYGRIRIHGKKTLTHRFAYSRAYGHIPDGFLVLHKCDNTLCCNPEHLFLGTQKDNMDDCKNKGRLYSGPVTWAPKGEKTASSKLTDKVVKEAKVMHFFSGLSQSQIARYYEVDPSVLHRAVRGKTWKHLNTIALREDENL